MCSMREMEKGKGNGKEETRDRRDTRLLNTSDGREVREFEESDKKEKWNC